MLIPCSQARDAYNLIRDRARVEQTAVLILVAGECDAIAASHTFTSFLRSDNIAFSLHPVNSYQDVFERLQSRDPGSYRSVVLFNCGANVNLEARLGWSDEQWAACQLFIFDSHRPIHFNNIYFDRDMNKDEYGNEIWEDNMKVAKVVIIDSLETIHDSVPTFEDVLQYEEDFDDYDDDGSMPAHRRRVGDTDDPAIAQDDDVIQQEKEKLASKRTAILRIEKYSSRSYRAGPSAFLMFTLAVDLRKDTNEVLWWGIVGLTDQFVNSLVGEADYGSILRVLVPEASRLNPEEGRQAANIGRIIHVDDLKFMLFRYWTLYDSMYHCEYIATNLQLWKDRKNDLNQLRTLLAKMGIARTEAEQKFLSMKASIQEEFTSRMKPWIESFKIEDYQFPTFHKVRHIAPYISAADCVHIASAMLNRPSTSTEKWEDWFYKAYDALQWCSSREDLWDEIMDGTSSAVQNSIQLQKLVIEKAFEIQTSKPSPIANIGNKGISGFRYLRIQVDDSNDLLAQPATLRKIGNLVAMIGQSQAKGRKSAGYRLLIGAENTTTSFCTVVGLESPGSGGFQTPNEFGKLFQMAVKGQSDIVVEQDLFDSECLRFSNYSFANFVGCVYDAMEILSEHAEKLKAIEDGWEDAEPSSR